MSQASRDNLQPIADDAIALGVVGPPEHGIPRLARQIADAAGDLEFRGLVLEEADPGSLEELPDRLPPAVRLLHLHVNDWLFTTGTAAGVRFEKLAARLADDGIRLSLTLHDLPQPADPPDLHTRRVGNYRSMVRSAVGTVVSSDHERRLLLDALADGPHLERQAPASTGSTGECPIQVIPLPIDPIPETRAVVPSAVQGPPTVGIFGYLYPGKGHRQVLEELAGIDAKLTVVAIGKPSARHGDLLDELDAVAGRIGLEFRCTGYLPDAEVPEQLRRVTIPVAPHTQVSASGSINSWLAAGRRPLVPAGRYVEELDRRMPGAVWIYQPGELLRCVQLALIEPELTLLPTHLAVGPGTSGVAQEYLSWLRQLVPA